MGRPGGSEDAKVLIEESIHTLGERTPLRFCLGEPHRVDAVLD